MSELASVFGAAQWIQGQLDEISAEFCFIGGIALQRWGEPRFTQDVDLTVLCPLGEEEKFATRISGFLAGRIPDAIAFSIRSRVFLGEAPDGTPVDLAFGGLQFEQDCVRRASGFEFARGCRLRTCDLDDFIVLKAFADRDKDRMDLEGVVRRNHGKIDWARIERDLKPLLGLKEAPESWERLLDLKKRYA
jgi:hypothetical protein